MTHYTARHLTAWLLLVACILSSLHADNSTWLKGASEVRTWTNKDGRTLEAAILGVEGDEVKVRRASDNYVLFIKLNALSQTDRSFVQIYSEVKHAEEPSSPQSSHSTDPFAHPIPTTGNVQFVTAEPELPIIQLGVNREAARNEIPSLGYNELDKDYDYRSSCFLNFIVWWNETIAPDLMRSEDRQKAIDKIKRTAKDYFEAGNHDFQVLKRYTKFQGRGYRISNVDGVSFYPSIEELQKWATGWYGVMVHYGFYEIKGEHWKRVNGHCASLISASETGLVQNANGKQYRLSLRNELAPLKYINRWAGYSGSKYKGLPSYENASPHSDLFVPKDCVAVIEQFTVFEISKIATSDEQ